MVNLLDEEAQKPLILVSPLNWVLLACFGGLFLAGIIYAFCIFIPVKVEGRGLVFNPNRTFAVHSLHSGSIKNIFAYGGEKVEKGSPLIEFDHPKEILKSETKGDVFEVGASVGNVIKRGEPLLWIQKPLSSEEVQQIAGVIPILESEQVRVGMAVDVYLVGVDATEYGHLKGKVASILPFFSEKEKKRFPIENIFTHSKKEDYTVLIVVDLLRDPQNPKEYLWTTAKGKSFPIQVGTQCKFSVVIEKKKLISYLFR